MQAKGSKASQICSNENRRPAAGRRGNWAKRPMLEFRSRVICLLQNVGSRMQSGPRTEFGEAGDPPNYGQIMASITCPIFKVVSDPPKMFGATVLVSGLGGVPFHWVSVSCLNCA